MTARTKPAPEPRIESSVLAIKSELERMIAAEEMRAGERVNESYIANLYSVSRGPVREACRLLERVGLLKSVMNKGFYVRSLSAKEALDIYDLRITLFGMAGRLATPRITDLQIRQLVTGYEDMEVAAVRGDVVQFYNLNTEFHQQIVEIADNYRLAEIWPTLENELQLFRRRGLATVETMQASNREHRAILDAMEAGNATLAVRVMEQHITEGKMRLLRSIGGPGG
jgi:DNA-binding GntR family transcriptional regulator